MKNFDKNYQGIIIGIVSVIVSLAVLFFLSNLFFNKAEEKTDEMTLSEIQKQYDKIHQDLFKVQGEFNCLPLKDENKPHNDLCVYGIENEDGNYYRLQLLNDFEGNVLERIKNGQRVEISGDLINEESDTYLTLGTINVVGVKFLETPEENLESFLPDSFKASYISFHNYSQKEVPSSSYPRLESWVENGEIECEESPAESSSSFRVNKKEINGQKYCIAAYTENNLEPAQTQYAYTTVILDKVHIVTFIARYQDCNNYEGEERNACVVEREKFNLDNLVDSEVR
ncbi:MAG: hypothetical protein PHH52_03050 [Patescibacteria group bacterium]|nr:hypothetical protein [Patescibacteria group bacterium]MDD3939791.1 hypothetical protein [Patescibacteria group bacterium]